MTTVRDLINRAYKDLTVLGEGDTATAEMMTDGLDVFNDIIDLWNAQELTLFQVQEETFSLSGAQSYTIGSGGVWNTTRPEHIESIWYRRDSVDYPVELLDSVGWGRIELKSDSTDWLYCAYYDAAFPLAKVYVHSLASTGSVLIQSRKLLSSGTLDTVISLPAGYAVTIRAEIASRLAGQFGKEVSASILRNAAEGMKAIKSRNNNRKDAGMCIEFAESIRGNILTDEN